MNHRERQQYEAKYGRHPSICNCPECLIKKGSRVVGLKDEDKPRKPPPKVDWTWLR